MIQGLARAIAIDYPSQSKRRLELGLPFTFLTLL